jgi:hypothetical protein
LNRCSQGPPFWDSLISESFLLTARQMAQMLIVRHSIRGRIYLGWNFALLIFNQAALYLFFRQELPELRRSIRRGRSERVLCRIGTCIAVFGVAGLLLLWPVWKALHANYLQEDTNGFLLTAAAGLGFGLTTVVLCAKIET